MGDCLSVASGKMLSGELLLDLLLPWHSFVQHSHLEMVAGSCAAFSSL